MAAGVIGHWEVEELELDASELSVELERYRAGGWEVLKCESCGRLHQSTTDNRMWRVRFIRRM